MSLFYRYENKIDIKDPPTEDDNISSKKYTDTKLLKCSNLDMSLYRLKKHTSSYQYWLNSKLYLIKYLNSHLNSSLTKTLICEYFTIHSECMYKIGTASLSEVA